MNIIENICISCNCNEQEAQEHLDGELRNLRELRDLNDLRDNDIPDACKSLGLESDYVSHFIDALAS